MAERAYVVSAPGVAQLLYVVVELGPLKQPEVARGFYAGFVEPPDVVLAPGVVKQP